MSRTRTIVAPGAPVLTIEIHNGDTGVEETLHAMRAVIHDASENSHAVKSLSMHLRLKAGIALLPREVYDYITRTFEFAADPRDTDAMMRPDEMIAALLQDRGEKPIARDCDDVAVFACSLLRAAGIPTALIVMSKTPTGPFEHVYWGVIDAVAPTHERPSVIPFDPQERTPPGQWTRPGVGRVRVYPVG